jgi:hypothetical protein
MSRFAVVSDTPKETVRAFSADLKALGGRCGLKEQMRSGAFGGNMVRRRPLPWGSRCYTERPHMQRGRALLHDSSTLGRTLLRLMFNYSLRGL